MLRRPLALLALLGVAVLAAAGGTASAAGTRATAPQAELVQMALVVPLRLWDDIGWMHRALELLSPAGVPRVDAIRVGGRKVSVIWGNASVSIGTTDEMLRYAARPYGGPYGGVKGLVVDRKLTAAERRLFTVVPLFTEADVVVAAAGSPLCAKGLSTTRVRALLTGTARGLRIASPAAQAGGARPMFDVVPKGPTAPEAALLAAPSTGRDAAAVSFQRARPLLQAGTVCALPLDGVAPTLANVRSGRYPVSRPVGLAFVNAVWRSPSMDATADAIRARFLELARGAPGTAFLRQVYGDGAVLGW